MMKDALSIYLVTNSDGITHDEFLRRVTQACESGVTLVQLREKELNTRDFYTLAQEVKKVTDEYQVPLIINDRVDICLAVDAAGVHIGDDELPVDVTRQLLGPDKWLGVSAKTVARGLEAKEQGADYLGVGAIYPTTTKVTTQITSLDALSQIIETTQLPTVGIGGITEDNMMTLKGTGIEGISVVSEIMKADDIPSKVRALKGNMLELKGGNRDDN